MNVTRIGELAPLDRSLGSSDQSNRPTFAQTLAAAVDGAAGAADRADMLAGAVALGSGSVVEASVARAKADVLLEIVSVAAARVGNALNSLLQTQA
jgi:flagellar hook-basal body complex protein FliE